MSENHVLGNLRRPSTKDSTTTWTWESCGFGTMKRLFGLHRVRYFGLARTHAQLAMAAMGQNLLKSAKA